MPYTLKVSKSPTDALSCTNCLIVGPDVQNKAFLKGTKCSIRCNKDEIQYVRLYANPGHKCLFAVLTSKQMKAGEVGLSLIQREWTQVTLQSEAILEPVMETIYIIESVTIKCDFFQKKVKTGEPFQHVKLVDDFKKTFANQPLTKDQKLVFKHENKPLLMMVVCDLKLIEKKPGLCGVVNLQTTQISFEKKEGSDAIIRGAKHIPPSEKSVSVFNPDWNFGNMGIGGLDKEFTAIFRRAFASRFYPTEIVEDLDMKHVKGILLYGPPGTGKTLMARQIGKMLSATQPKIVNGPEILNKFVGESEKNIRDLFAEAEKDQKEMGPNSPLHMIIFDEIDAICKQRGTVTGSTGVADTVVNQLLSKIDGVEQLNNILVIGMTNRKDLIDEALLRPGRLEVQMEINLPNEEGRLQILNIHTSALRTNRRLGPAVNLSEISKEIKNYSGAEIEGLVRAATSTAFNKMITQENGKVSVDSKAINYIMVTNEDFRYAIENDIKPAFGHGSEDAEHFLANGVIDYGEPFQHILKTSEILINQTRNGKLVSPVTVLLEGPPGCGKTSVAAHVAFNMAEFPFIKVVSPENMIGFSESARCQAIKKIFDDAYKSELSCIVVDDIERLIEYTAIGPRFSNVILQTLIVLLKKKVPKKHKLLVIGTTSSKKLLQDMDVTNCFNSSINIPPIRDVIHMTNVVCALGMFQDAEVTAIENRLKVQSLQLKIDLTKLMSFVEMAIQAEDSVTAFVDFVKTHCGVIY